MDVRVESGGGGEVMVWRCRADAEAVARMGRVAGFSRAEEGADGEDGSMSPAAVESLLVKLEIAQPAQEAASLACGVLMRGVVETERLGASGGSAVSAISAAALRIWRR